ncbi:hypothetical protein ABT009_34110 [Streptomyces sp. NPDC002896]|uniref:hypothetical protein n=1 Tax=Streptomyces sp. NPDC002896 TaxID=3154438 RepID=UPI0033225A1F
MHRALLARRRDSLETSTPRRRPQATPCTRGFVGASVVDPFGNILGIMYNPHYLEVLGSPGDDDLRAFSSC